jgi:glycine/D-amino acid oxidase-like deaminating enzyme
MADVIIVGGGVIGCAMAYYLTAAGNSDVLPRGEWADTTLQEATC